MPRLLIATDSLRTGMGLVAWGLANSLDARYEVHILSMEKSFSPAKRPLTVHLVSPLHYPFTTIAYSTILRPIISKIVRRVSPDIVHSLGVLPWGYVFRSREITKTIITPSGSDVYPRKGRPMWLHFVDRAVHDPSALVCNSKWLSSYMLENYHVRSVVIPTAVDTQVFRPLGELGEGKVVLFVGRLIKKKGILELMEAARALPEYQFWLVGEGPLRIPAQPNVKILGFQYNTVPLYASATICAFPFHHDNFPLVGLEAMACGRAVVATQPGFSEYIENGKDGILVKPRDVRTLIDSIRYLMENEEARRRIEWHGRRKAAQYDWNVIAKRYEALYEAL